MELIKPGTYVDFMKHRTPVVGASLALVVMSLVSLFVPGPNYGIDFAGGTEVQVAFESGDDLSVAELRGLLEDLGYDGADVVTAESAEENQDDFIIRIREISAIPEEQKDAIEQALGESLGEDVLRLTKFSPGGDKITLRLSNQVPNADIRAAVEGAGVEIRGELQVFTGSEDVRVEIPLEGIADELVAQVSESLAERAPVEVRRTEWVGPKAGQQLRDAAIKSLLYAIAFIMVYVAFRFDLRFAPGGVIAMFHDVVITLGIYVLVQKEVNLTTVAALLTILGYSINDTIVVYDRIRENMGRLKDKSLRELINISTSQMLSRTIVTSGTTLLSVIAFFIWGTPVIQDISFALFCGILIGTYSSIYVAAPITEYMDKRFFNKAA